MAQLPYVTAPGRLKKAFATIKTAATPPKVSQDFVKTVLNVPGGSGTQVTSFLKKVGFVDADGSPSELYRSFRNPSTSGAAVAKALRIGYEALYKHNEYMHQLPDNVLRGLIMQVTGDAEDSSVVGLVLASIKAMKEFAGASNGDEHDTSVGGPVAVQRIPEENHSYGDNLPRERVGGMGLNLSYTINLNLPATSDIAVFNAIFKSLKDNLLRSNDE